MTDILPEDYEKTRSWLRPTAYDHDTGEYQKHLACLEPSTGSWLAASSVYQSWVGNGNDGSDGSGGGGLERSVLWIAGTPGSGKSVLAAKLIRDLSQSGATVLHFFFRQTLDTNRTAGALLLDWLHQLLPHSRPLQQSLRDKRHRSLDAVSVDEFFHHLTQAVNSLPHLVYCIIDAADEMASGNAQFLDDLIRWASVTPSRVRLLITSRPVADVADLLQSSEAPQIRLDPDIVDRDISTFVRQRLVSSDLSVGEQERVHRAIASQANGQFLYAKLAMDAFLRPGADVSTLIEKLPVDLNAIYTSLLQEHSRRAGVPDEVICLVLQAATHTTRPLRLLEMAALLRSGCPDAVPTNIGEIKSIIRAACGPLLEIPTNNVVAVIHHTLTEYLTGATRETGDGGHPVLDAADAHFRLALLCVEYLSSVLDAEQNRDISSENRLSLDLVAADVSALIRTYPFVDYAAKNWAVHASRTSVQAQQQLNEAIHVLFQKPLFRRKGLQLWWVHAWHNERHARDESSFGTQLHGLIWWQKDPNAARELQEMTPLHLAARLGLPEYARRLASEEGVDVDAGDQRGRSPLYWAAQTGHAEVVRVLVSMGANPDLPDSYGGKKPLHLAVTCNQAQAALALLEAGVSPLTRKTKENPGRRCGNSRGTKGGTPWMYACQQGRFEAFETLLRYVKSPKDLAFGLMLACRNGHEKAAARLLLHPKLKKLPEELGRLLLNACYRREAGIVKALLAAGANANTVSYILSTSGGMVWAGFGSEMPPQSSCLEALCGSEHERSSIRHASAEQQSICDIMAMLIDHGADVHAPTSDGGTLLHHAALSPALVRRLLDFGINAKHVNRHGDSALHLSRNAEAVAVLVEHGGAELEARNARRRTPLLQMLSRTTSEGKEETEAVLKLLSFEPDCRVVDDSQRGALHYAVMACEPDERVIRRLLELGADPGMPDANGSRPYDLLPAGVEYSTRVLRIFREVGMDVDAKDADGRSRLFNLIQDCDSVSQLKELIDLGASVSTRDATGRSLLHEAVSELASASFLGRWQRDEGKVFRFLLGLGLDPRAVDFEGNTLLHEYAALATGAAYPGDNRRTGNESAWGVLTGELDLDINQPNHAGRTPLHVLAAGWTDQSGWDVSSFAQGAINVLSGTFSLDVQDNEGIAPLHLASLKSRVFTKVLLDRGANPRIATAQGLTPLHLAARASNATGVGLLLDALAGASRDTDGPSAPGSGFWYFDGDFSVPDVDSRDQRGWTSLSYACQAGRPEIVNLLLKAGADPKLQAHLQACTLFEGDMAAWAGADGRTTGPEQPTQPFGLRVEDIPRTACPNCWGTIPRPWCRHASARIDDILPKLLESGGFDEKQLDDLLDLASTLSDSTGKDYTRHCFYQAILGMTRNGTNAVNIDPAVREIMSSWCKHHLEWTRVRLMGPCGTAQVQPGKRYMALFWRILRERAYPLVIDLARAGVDLFSSDPDYPSDQGSAVTQLMEAGFSRLVEEIWALKTQELSQKQHGGFNAANLVRTADGPHPHLLAAVKSPEPNMAVLQLLVEDLGAGLRDGLQGKKRARNEGDFSEVSTNALHLLAEGSEWWHVALALPYLIKHGTDVTLRNREGKTPFEHAFVKHKGPFSGEGRLLLTRAGAGESSSSSASGLLAVEARNPTLASFLAENMAEPNTGALFALIHHREIELLEELLQKWPAEMINTRGRLPEEPDNGGWSDSESESKTTKADWYPLHYALCACRPRGEGRHDVQSWRSEMSRIIQLLLDKGADPFAVYPSFEGPETSRPSKEYMYRLARSRALQGTLLHEAVLCKTEFLDCILDREGLDIGRRDHEGRTILHMACIHDPDISICSRSGDATDGRSETHLSPVQAIIAHGADPLARDYSGRNVLHHALYMYAESDTPDTYSSNHVKTLEILTHRYPSLVNQRTNAGKTPLLLALHRAAIHQDATAAVTHLLSVGADCSVVDESGNGVFHLLAEGIDQDRVMQVFHRIRREHPELPIDVKNNLGQTPLFVYARGELSTRRKQRQVRRIAMFYEKKTEPLPSETPEAVLQMFQEAGADFGVRDTQGRGLLHAAAHINMEMGVGVSKALHARGLDPFLEDAGGQTPVDIAAAGRNSQVLAMFDQ